MRMRKEERVSLQQKNHSLTLVSDLDWVFFSTNMYHFEYHQKSPYTLRNAHIEYDFLFHEWLSDESIEARYHLLEYLSREYNYRGVLEKEVWGKPIPVAMGGKKIYWSLSHSENFIAFIISETPTGIDIAEYRERDISLLDTQSDEEYDILWGKDWEHFYILWTAKESLIKFIGNTLDDMEDISLLEKISDSESLFGFRQKNYRIKTIINKDEGIIISYTI